MAAKILLLGSFLVVTAIAGALFATYGLRRDEAIPKAIPFTTVYWGGSNHSLADEGANLAINNSLAGLRPWSNVWDVVINDNDTWARVWLGAFSPCCWVMPRVHFASTTVLAVSLQWGPKPDYKINVTEVSRSGSYVLVHILIVDAGLCAQPEIPIYPTHIVSIPKTELPFHFEEEFVSFSC